MSLSLTKWLREPSPGSRKGRGIREANSMAADCVSQFPPARGATFHRGFAMFETALIRAARLLGAAALTFAVQAHAAYPDVPATLYSFTDASDGKAPLANLVQAGDGTFYGTTSNDGGACCGTIFSLETTGITGPGSIITLYNFTNHQYNSDGGYPVSGLILTSDGAFYGTTRSGGLAVNDGAIFKYAPNATPALSTVYRFSGGDGSHPVAGLVQAADGNLYGTTSDGGTTTSGGLNDTNNGGVVFQFVPATQSLNVIHAFTGGSSDGQYPQGGLIQASDGNLYGTTFAGGADNCGTIYRITTLGVESLLYSFTCAADQGAPMSALVQGTDGALYGTTSAYGLRNNGTIFRITLDGSFQTLYTFTAADDGLSPQAGLLLGSDGNLYGTTPAVGEDGTHNGTVFRFSPGPGTMTPLYGFSVPSQGINTDGLSAVGGLIEGADGNLYGVTAQAGLYGAGTVFGIATALPAPISLSVNPGSIIQGQSATLNWALANPTGGSASLCFASGDDSSWTGSQSSSGSRAVTPSGYGALRYSLTCGGTTSGSVTLNVTQLLPPAGLAAVAGDGQVDLSWSAAAGATGYVVHYGPANATVQSLSVSGTTATVTGLTNGTVYYFKVATVDNSAQSAFSASVSATPAVPLPPLPDTPQNLAAAPGDAQVSLSWSAAANAASYTIYQKAGGGTFSAIATGVTQTQYLATGLTNGTPYTYVVASVNAAGSSGNSTAVTATPLAPLEAPADVVATAGTGQVVLTWSPVTNASSYTLYMGTASNSEVEYVQDIQGGSNPVKYTVTGLTNDTTYYFYIVAIGPIAPSPQSAEVSATPTQVPDKVANLTASPGDTTVTLRWDAVAGAQSYTIYQQNPGGAATVAAKDVTGTSYTVKNLKNNTTYGFAVAAVNQAGVGLSSDGVSATPEGNPGSGGALAPEVLCVLGMAALLRRRRR